MMQRLLGLFLLCTVPLTVHAQPVTLPPSRAGDVDAAADYEATLTDLLQAIVTDRGRVRYDLLRGRLHDDFRRVLKAIEAFDPTTLHTSEAKLAFWLNAYNVQMLQHIVETPDVTNIMQEGYADDFFTTPLRTAQMPVSLDQIEHVILRRQEGPDHLTPHQVTRLDPRIHVGLNCAAVSCPRLRQRAFTAENVDAELDAAMREFVSSPKHVHVEGDRVVLSSILDWYGEDFDRPDQPAGDYLLSFMAPSRPHYSALKLFLEGRTADEIKTAPLTRYEYHWTVNRASANP